MSTYQKLKVIEALSPRELDELYAKSVDELEVDWCNVHAIKHSLEGNYIIRNHIWGANVCTDVGDVFYAQKAAGETPTNDFTSTSNRLVLRTASQTPAKTHTYGSISSPLAGSHKSRESGYPRSNDPDSLNNVTNKTRKITWKYVYLTTEGNHATIYGGAVHLGADSPVTGTVLLSHFTFAGTVPFEKTTSDTLTVYVNHEMLGA
jgi:hypothetical protein